MTFPMTPIPPSTTSMVTMVRSSPVFSLGTPKATHMASAMELDWVMFPMPKDAVTAKSAKRNPSAFPALFTGNPRRQVYMGPPAICPLSFIPLYFTASMLSTSLVAIPTTLVITIQNKAPGPPRTMAVATPTIFPIPRVVASSVVRDARDVTFPEDAFFPFTFPFSAGPPPKAHFKANFRFFRGRRSRRSIR